jgi:hypothetical protein
VQVHFGGVALADGELLGRADQGWEPAPWRLRFDTIASATRAVLLIQVLMVGTIRACELGGLESGDDGAGMRDLIRCSRNSFLMTELIRMLGLQATNVNDPVCTGILGV